MNYQDKLEIVIDYINSLDSNIITNYQINSDIQVTLLIKDKNIAIEFVPNQTTTKHYFPYRTIACNNLGIRLITIFEHEFDKKWFKIQNLISMSLGIFENRTYARKCFVAELDSATYRSFLDKYHLQSSINMSSVRYGLYTNINELVSVIGFGFNRFKTNEVELHRFCTKSGWQIVGGFSKLLKHSGISNFTSYIDYAHFTGNGHKQIGFQQQAITLPSYVYVKNGEVLTRISCQKHKLQKRFKDFNPLNTEIQIMKDHGWTQVFDCGCIKMTYQNNSGINQLPNIQSNTLSNFIQ